MNRLLYAALVVSLLGSSAAFAQSDPTSDLSPAHREFSNPQSSVRDSVERDLGEQAASREDDAAAARDRKQHRLKDPKSGCAVFDSNGLPVDAAAWSGRCVGGLASDPGTVTFSKDGKFFESLAGDFDKGKVRDGHVTVKWADGSTYDGDEAAARMEGFGLLTTAAGDRFQGQWASDRLNGHGLVVWANGDRYEGDWRDGKAEGHGVQIWSDGRKYDGEWRNDLPEGHGVVTRTDGSRYEGTFAGGQPKDIAEMADEAPGGATVAADVAQPPAAVPANADETAAPPSNEQDAADGEASVLPSNIAELAGKKLSAVDGSTLALTPTEGGLAREIVAPGGAVKKTVFMFLNDKLGTVYEGSDSSNAAGVFRITDTGVATDYADGRLETLRLSGSGGVLMTLSVPAGETSCTVWYPEGHRFSAEERKAALAEYANRLGLDKPRRKMSRLPVKSSCLLAAAKLAPVPRAGGLAATSRFPARGKTAAPTALAARLAAAPARDPRLPIVVPTSKVHLIDADALAPVQTPDSKTLASNEPASVAGGSNVPSATMVSASACLSVESDGRHWDFRNRCAYDVQFAYCLMNGSDPLTACGEGAVSGSVAANGIGALIADQGLKDTDTDHDFRWVACGGGAGEVVVHLDRIDPPAGRCVRPGAS